MIAFAPQASRGGRDLPPNLTILYAFLSPFTPLIPLSYTNSLLSCIDGGIFPRRLPPEVQTFSLSSSCTVHPPRLGTTQLWLGGIEDKLEDLMLIMSSFGLDGCYAVDLQPL